MNWLHIHELWLYLLALSDSPVTQVGPQWWHDYLNGDTADTTPASDTCRAKHLKNLFHVVLSPVAPAGDDDS